MNILLGYEVIPVRTDRMLYIVETRFESVLIEAVNQKLTVTLNWLSISKKNDDVLNWCRQIYDLVSEKDCVRSEVNGHNEKKNVLFIASYQDF